MDIKDFGTKVNETHDSVIRLEGKVSTLTELVGVYQSQSSKLEGRLWGALIMSVGALASAILSLIIGGRH